MAANQYQLLFHWGRGNLQEFCKECVLTLIKLKTMELDPSNRWILLIWEFSLNKQNLPSKKCVLWIKSWRFFVFFFKLGIFSFKDQLNKLDTVQLGAGWGRPPLWVHSSRQAFKNKNQSFPQNAAESSRIPLHSHLLHSVRYLFLKDKNRTDTSQHPPNSSSHGLFKLRRLLSKIQSVQSQKKTRNKGSCQPNSHC